MHPDFECGDAAPPSLRRLCVCFQWLKLLNHGGHALNGWNCECVNLTSGRAGKAHLLKRIVDSLWQSVFS
jgi:hypothetical protein